VLSTLNYELGSKCSDSAHLHHGLVDAAFRANIVADRKDSNLDQASFVEAVLARFYLCTQVIGYAV
jgi:hypothetical protein